MTREEIVAELAQRLARKESFPMPTRADFRQGGAALLADDAAADKLVAAWQENDAAKLGTIIIQGIKDWMTETKSTVDVEAMLSPDDTLDLTELERFL